MVLYNKFLINLINTMRHSNIVEGKEFDQKNVFSNKWDDICAISYEDYLACQNEQSFLADITTLANGGEQVQIGIIIGDVTELPIERAAKLSGKVRIYIYDPEEEKMASNSYFYLDEYIEAQKKLDELMAKVNLSEPDELKKAKQMYVLLRKEYEHAFPTTGDIFTNIRHSQNMYGCLCLKKGVCAGGSNTFRAMCTLGNIKCRTIIINVTYHDNNTFMHVLNQICINGEWGIVDVEQKKNTPEETSLFFCTEDDYITHWKNENATYEVHSLSSCLMPTHISLTRAYIDSLEIESNSTLQSISSQQTTEGEELRTLAISEIASGGTTMGELTTVHLEMRCY